MNMRHFVIAGFILFLMSGFAISGKGGIQVSLVTADCGDSDKDAEVLESASPARIWVNVPAGTNTDGLSYEISDQAKPITNPITFTVTACGDAGRKSFRRRLHRNIEYISADHLAPERKPFALVD